MNTIIVGRDLTQDSRRWHVTVCIDGALFYSNRVYRDDTIMDAIERTRASLAPSPITKRDEESKEQDHPQEIDNSNPEK